jgi:hypothetical protein
MADITNVKLGVCSVKFAGSDLGHTKGGVTVSYEAKTHEKTVDLYGETPVDINVIGESLKAIVPLAELTIANLGIALPAGTKTASKITLGGEAGKSLESVADELVLHPIANASNDLSDDVVLYKAIATGKVDLSYKVDDETIIEVEFTALIDETRSDGDQLGMIGDSTS